MTPAGFPHSEISGSKPVCGSPKLIAAYHVLHRLSAPRHPPYTLSSLTKLECFTLGESYSLSPDSVVNEPCSRALPARPRGSLGSALATNTSWWPPRIPGSLPLREAVPKSSGGADRARTDDLRLARAALSRLSYSPVPVVSTGPTGPVRLRAALMVGLGRLELPTSRLSGVRSNQLSYRPRQGSCRFPGN